MHISEILVLIFRITEVTCWWIVEQYTLEMYIWHISLSNILVNICWSSMWYPRWSNMKVTGWQTLNTYSHNSLLSGSIIFQQYNTFYFTIAGSAFIKQLCGSLMLGSLEPLTFSNGNCVLNYQIYPFILSLLAQTSKALTKLALYHLESRRTTPESNLEEWTTSSSLCLLQVHFLQVPP